MFMFINSGLSTNIEENKINLLIIDEFIGSPFQFIKDLDIILSKYE